MPKIALFLDRPSVEGVRIIECAGCGFFVDYFCYTDPERHSFGRQSDAWEVVQMHSRDAHHGAPRIVQAVRP